MIPSSSRSADTAVHRGRTYRITVAGTVTRSFHDAFPQLAARLTNDNNTLLEGIVANPAQLAGIVSAICYRGTPVLHLEVAGGATSR